MRLFIFFSVIYSIQCAKILGVFPVPSYSHFTLGFRLMKELAEKGHNVTVISPFPQKSYLKNYEDIHLEGSTEDDRRLFNLKQDVVHISMFFETIVNESLTEKTLSNNNVQNILHSNRTFDLVILEYFMNEALMGIGYHFKAPLILLSSMPACNWNNHLTGNPSSSSYIPNILSSFVGKMNFFERILNHMYDIIETLIMAVHTTPKQNKLLQKYIPNAPDIQDVMYNTSILLMNSHVSVTDALPHVPNMVEIGGYHVTPPSKLSMDLQKYLDESRDGCILFSMGTHLKSSDFPEKKIDILLSSFKNIKQRVLWKFDGDQLPNLPSNVKLVKWIPQQDVLRHPNLVAFITHGGYLSVIEAIYFGKPLIGLTIFHDHKKNILQAQKRGLAINLPYEDLTEQLFLDSINKIIYNKRYTSAAKEQAKIMRDRPIQPIDLAMYWIEYVIRHKGAAYYKSLALDLAWYERNLTDVMIFYFIILIPVIFLMASIFRNLVFENIPKEMQFLNSNNNKKYL